jgi:hypothetical protein
MNLASETLRFKFLTPCFSGTAEGRNPAFSELRVPPIRGQIRFWHRAVFGPESANHIWGSTNGNEGSGSRIAVRIESGTPASRQTAQLLPHKTHGQGSRPALPAEAAASFQLQRLPACANDDWQKALGATQLWLVAGTLGYRSSRAAGSVWPQEPWAPGSRAELARLLAPLIARSSNPWGAALVAEAAQKSWGELRETASDTSGGNPQLFGRPQPREPSPVRFKVIELANGLCLLVIGPSKEFVENAEVALRNKPGPHRWIDLGVWKPL